MSKTDDIPDRTQTGKYAHLNELELGGIERQLAAGKYVDAAELVSALRELGQRPIPPIILDYICKMLEGAVRTPRGRKAQPVVIRQWRRMTIAGVYREYLRRLEDRKRKFGAPAGWTRLDYPPGELAARIVAKNYLGRPASWRTVQNIASSRK
jgi:hypothetical protein